jgi:uncharacterized protein YjbI with pentapeptide repeats
MWAMVEGSAEPESSSVDHLTSGARPISQAVPAAIDEVGWRVLGDAVFGSGELGIAAWNNRRARDPSRPELDRVDLRGRKLFDVDFSNCSLRYARFEGAVLLGAKLRGADLRGADLTAAQLQGANLSNAILYNAKLERANLRWSSLAGADLRNANLNEASVDPCDMSGADLEGAQFSAPVLAGFNQSLAQLEDAGAHPRAVFAALLGLCLFAVVTAATASPIALITRQGSVKLPILDSEVTMRAFFFIVPPMTFGLLAYLVVYLAQLGSSMRKLPLRYPDGLTVVDKLSPWLKAAISSVTLYESQLLSQTARSTALLRGLIRWTVPVTATFLLWCLFRSRSATDLWCNYGLTLAMWGGSIALWCREGRSAPRLLWGITLGGGAALALTALAIAIITRRVANVATSAGVMNGLAQLLHIDSSKPFPLQARGKDFSCEVLQHLNLGGSDLSYAKLAGTALADVDLRGALLLGAELKNLGAICLDLRAARLVKAELSGASLTCVSLNGAQLQRAVLTGTVIAHADLRAADLRGAIVSADTRFSDVLCDENTRWPESLATVPSCSLRIDPQACASCPPR